VGSSQLNSVSLYKGWVVLDVLQTSDGWVATGLGQRDRLSGTLHNLIIQKIDTLGQIRAVDTFFNSGDHFAMHNPGNVLNENDGKTVVGALIPNDGGAWRTVILKFNLNNNLKKLDTLSLGYATSSHHVTTSKDRLIVFSSYQPEHLSPIFLKKIELDSYSEILNEEDHYCSGWRKYECGVRPRNLTRSTSGDYVLSCQQSLLRYSYARQPQIIGYDSNLSKKWWSRIELDSFYTSNPMSVILEDGNILVFHVAEAYQEWMNPKGSNGTPQALQMPFLVKTILDSKGDVIEHIKLRYLPVRGFDYSFGLSDIKVTDKGEVILVGNGTDYEDFILMVKSDQNGNLIWARRMNLNKLDSQNMKLGNSTAQGVTISAKGFAVFGQHTSYPDSISPSPIVSGFIAYLDSDGCLEKNCANLLDIDAQEQINNEIKIYPNPSVEGLFILDGLEAGTTAFATVTNMKGQKILDKRIDEQNRLIKVNSSGVFVLHLKIDQLRTAVYKIVVP
jgi:hypothetical protein